ncbi:non-canonical purine NTP pyrophosphatase [Silvibacterium dinghuense]|uniref:dITP/XTP pyrophosphatase n=1 Tax=Silvibacterium dinghuense TaxID=1560006 RepID=A0A4Q1SF53_9BACT|nr:non-canonical purine NTP pyrophosphatase [Silvibacterium dinghuense]
MNLFLATTNAGKLRDFAAAGLDNVVLEALPNLKELPVPEENEDTFAGNATIKAVAYSRHAPGLIVLADDSGLEVDALDGQPGVRSARYAADAAFSVTGVADSDALNNLLLLERLHGIPEGRRTGRYRCVLAAARNGELLLTADGTVEGTILEAPRGTGGFGYDPLFFVPEYSQTMAELDPVIKIAINHRGRALAQLLNGPFRLGS